MSCHVWVRERVRCARTSPPVARVGRAPARLPAARLPPVFPAPPAGEAPINGSTSPGRKLTRNEEMSRRILASLRDGGKMPPAVVVAPRFHAESPRTDDPLRAIIRRRLGVTDAL